jgi:anti-anti-sigma factor
VTAALAAAPRVVIDLSEIDYISSAGIRALQQAGERVVVCGLHDAVRIALELSGVLSGIGLMGTRVEALESLTTHHDH